MIIEILLVVTFMNVCNKRIYCRTEMVGDLHGIPSLTAQVIHVVCLAHAVAPDLIEKRYTKTSFSDCLRNQQPDGLGGMRVSFLVV